MLAVAAFQLDEAPNGSRLAAAAGSGRISYLHASAENTTLGCGDVDMVSLSLVSHELPTAAARKIFQQAYEVPVLLP